MKPNVTWILPHTWEFPMKAFCLIANLPFPASGCENPKLNTTVHRGFQFLVSWFCDLKSGDHRTYFSRSFLPYPYPTTCAPNRSTWAVTYTTFTPAKNAGCMCLLMCDGANLRIHSEIHPRAKSFPKSPRIQVNAP